MYQFLDEMDMWNSVEKNPKEMVVLGKQKKEVKIMFFSIGTVST
jgi:hypothetical protein